MGSKELVVIQNKCKSKERSRREGGNEKKKRQTDKRKNGVRDEEEHRKTEKRPELSTITNINNYWAQKAEVAKGRSTKKCSGKV